MTTSRLRFPWAKRGRGRRAPQHRDDPTVVFKTFVRVLEQLRASPRGADHATLAAQREKA